MAGDRCNTTVYNTHMTTQARNIDCEQHGSAPAVFACIHLAQGVGCGYFVDDEHHDDTPRACCAACHTLAAADRDYVPVCSKCAASMQREHSSHGVAGLEAPATDEQLQNFFTACMATAQARNRIIVDQFGMSSGGTWFYDDETATLTTGPADARRMICDVELVGSFSHTMQTWLWAWANGSLPQNRRQRVGRLRTFGDVRGIPIWTQASPFDCDIPNAWGLTLVAAVLLDAEAVYRMPGSEQDWFALLYNVRAPN